MRVDLLALTPESLVALSNPGLLKRAQRELAAGAGPAVLEEADGTVFATFPDGAVARLPPGADLRSCPCSCGAMPVCRHRLAAVLAYQRAAGESAPPPAPSVTGAGPASIPDERLAALLGERIFERARALRARGLIVTVSPATPGDPLPSARLPTGTVRFHVPADPAFARCDCAQGTACEHIALAVWAFRELSPGAAATVQLGRRTGAAPAASRALAAITALAEEMLASGLEQSTNLAARAAEAHALAAAEDCTWLAFLIEDLERLFEAYRARSALYDDALLVDLLLEAGARVRAARAAERALPAAFVLGQGQPGETVLDRLTLWALGARVSATARGRRVEVFLADPDSATVLAVTREWASSEADPIETGQALAGRAVAPGVQLGALARGRLVTAGARRRANLALTLPGRGGASAVTAAPADWAGLPGSLCFTSFRALADLLRGRPPRALRPRVVADSLFVVRVAGVEQLAYDPALQEVSCQLLDGDGERLRLALQHRALAPNAVPAVARAAREGITYACGIVRYARLLQMAPVGLVTPSGLVVPDLEGPGDAPRLPVGVAPPDDDPVAEAIRAVGDLLAGAARAGVARRSALAEEAARAAARCEASGLRDLAARTAALSRERTASAWMDLAIRWDLTIDRSVATID